MKSPRSVLVMLFLLLVPTALLGAETSEDRHMITDMNPNIGINALFLGQWNDDQHTAEENFIRMQETELRFTAAVDRLWDGDLVVALHPPHDHDEDEVSHGLTIDIEVAALRSLWTPDYLDLTLGRFYLPFGRHASLHTHAYPFAFAPVAQRMILGEHGLTETGGIVAYRPPLPWSTEISVYGVNGDSGLFDADDADPAIGAHVSSAWDLGDVAHLEAGGSWLHGPAALSDGMAGGVDLLGADLTWTWASSSSISAEIYRPEFAYEAGDPLGWFTHIKHRVHEAWWLNLGYGTARDMTEHEHGHADKIDDHERMEWREWKAGLAYTPSDRSTMRLELSSLEEVDGDMSDLRLNVLWHFTIGSHGDHDHDHDHDH
jgi:hypothetical protein